MSAPKTDPAAAGAVSTRGSGKAMELAVVRIYKAHAASGPPAVHTSVIASPDGYVSQSPFMLLSEEWHTAEGGLPRHWHAGIVTAIVVLEGSLTTLHGTSPGQKLGRGDTAFVTAGAGVAEGELPGERGTRLLRLWVRLPLALRHVEPGIDVVHRRDARSSALDRATVLVYAGTLAGASAPFRTAWPVSLAELRLPPETTIAPMLPASERCFAYVLEGTVDIGRNRVRLRNGHIAWIERTLDRGATGQVRLHSFEQTRILLVASPVDDATLEREGSVSAELERAHRELRTAQAMAHFAH